MEWNIAHRKLSGIGTEFNFKNYPVCNILSFLYVTEYSQKHAQKIQLTVRTFAHYNWNLHLLCWKNTVQKGFQYVTEYSQKHAQKIQLTKHQKATIQQPPHKNSNPSLRPGQHPLGHLFVSRYQFSNPSVRKNWKPMFQTIRFCWNNMW